MATVSRLFAAGADAPALKGLFVKPIFVAVPAEIVSLCVADARPVALAVTVGVPATVSP